MRGDNRVSIWDVPSRAKRLYVGLFAVLTTLGGALVVFHTLTYVDGDAPRSWVATVVIIWKDMSQVGIASATAAVVITEGVNYLMVLSESLRLRVEKKKESLRNEGLEQGLERGLEQGIEQGRSEMSIKIRQWNERRLAAEQVGEEFDEPLPQ